MKKQISSNRKIPVSLIAGLITAFLLIPLAPNAQENSSVASGPALALGAISDNENQLLEQALASINMTPADLGFRKGYPGNMFGLTVIQNTLENPLSLTIWGYSWDESLLEPKSVGEIISKASVDLDTILPAESILEATANPNENSFRYYRLPDSWLVPIMALDQSVKNSRDVMEKTVLAGVSAEDIQYLRGDLPERFNAMNFSAPNSETTGQPEKIAALSSKFDILSLMQAARSVSGGVDRAVVSLNGVIGDLKFTRPVLIHGISGPILIGTPSDDIFYLDNYEPLSIIIDPGGNDIYYGNIAAAGNFEGENYLPVSVALDFSGDDVYISDGARSCGSGIFGIAELVDLSGNDIYKTGDFGLGCGLFGVGVMVDKTGSDFYEGGVFTQGAGGIGLGILSDDEGSDTYRASMYAQGMGWIRGFGLLTDRGGNDAYYAGGLVSDFPDQPESSLGKSQGYGEGIYAIASGGIGILHDRTGNDSYTTDIYAQGASYWYSIGMLIDDEGNDRYTARKYAQGAGTGISSGFLLDRSGDDHFSSGVSSQGFGGEYGLGWFIDEAGDDLYAGRKVTQGAAETNGIGLMFDRAGDDGYFSHDVELATGFGAVGESESGYGSVGIFIDEAGIDTYTEKNATDGSWWTKDTYGVGIDVGESWWQAVTDATGTVIGSKLVIPGT